MRSRRWYLATVIVAGLTLQCDSQPAGPRPPSFAKHPTLTSNDSIPLTGQPFAVAVAPSNITYVTQLSAGNVARTVLPSMSFTTFAIGPVPSQVRISPNGQTAYVNNQGQGGPNGTSTIKFINVATNAVFDTVTVPGSVLTTGISPNGTRLYALTDGRGVYIIDALSGSMIDSIPQSSTGSILVGVAFHPFLLRMYITARDSGKVVTINTQTNAIVNVTSVTGGKLQNVAVSRDGTTLFATDIQRSKLITWNLVSGTPAVSPQETAIGTQVSTNAFDVAVTPDNVQLYVSALADGKVYVLDRATRTLITSIQTSGKPRYIGFDYPGETAVIPNELGWVNFIR